MLGHAVDGAKTPDEVAAVDANDFTLGKQAGKNVERDTVIGIIEGGNEDEIVGDIKVGVAGGQTLSAKDDRAGKRQLNDLKPASVKISGGAEAAKIFLKRCIVGIGAAGLNRGENGIGGDEAGDVIDMAVRVITLNAAAQPDYFFYA